MSSPNYQAGRIHKQAFVVSTAVLIGFCLLSVVSRFYIRLRVQNQLSIDDGFLVVALCCLICALAILYSVTIDKMYLVEALTIGLPGAEIPPDVLQQSYAFHKWITVTLMLAWSAIMAVKFSFLFLFRKLIDRIRPLIMYWWVITAFNVVVLGYGISVYYVACPYYDDPRALQCTTGPGTARTMRHSIAQTTLDLLGDFLILYIPVKLIIKLQIRWTQKAILAFSLCLTVIMILITITRMAGIKQDGIVDQVWETYFIIIAAEIGIILTAVTSFRVLFVSRQKKDKIAANVSPGDRKPWYSLSTYLLKRVFTASLWRSSRKAQFSSEGYQADENGHFSLSDLPKVPRAHMTGIRTFIDNRGQGTDASHIMESQAIQEDEGTWPLYEKDQQPQSQV